MSGKNRQWEVGQRRHDGKWNVWVRWTHAHPWTINQVFFSQAKAQAYCDKRRSQHAR